jgi:hypothetical protein
LVSLRFHLVVSATTLQKMMPKTSSMNWTHNIGSVKRFPQEIGGIFLAIYLKEWSLPFLFKTGKNIFKKKPYIEGIICHTFIKLVFLQA